MKNKARDFVGDAIIKLGEHAVGKSIAIGMFDPEIPQKLRDGMKQNGRNEGR